MDTPKTGASTLIGSSANHSAPSTSTNACATHENLHAATTGGRTISQAARVATAGVRPDVPIATAVIANRGRGAVSADSVFEVGFPTAGKSTPRVFVVPGIPRRGPGLHWAQA
ncbi:hypothetical protein OHS18_21870 [Amycolatopsis sp. NBC_00355]|uniref:hypothetical protein n=1 Tax=Amycolatopsis sp. NBC_00355 TaxID=2975957 RepID=UPI002E252F39